MNDRRVVALVAGIGGCLVALLLCISAFIIGIGGLTWAGMQEPQGVDIQMISPAQVAVDEQFTFIIRIQNTGKEAQTLRRIDITTDYLDGFEISRIKPIYSYKNRANVLGIGVEILQFHELILEGETLDVIFDATALKAGDFKGNLDVCVNSDIVCKKIVTRTVVTE
jgi:hypothetical protein